MFLVVKVKGFRKFSSPSCNCDRSLHKLQEDRHIHLQHFKQQSSAMQRSFRPLQLEFAASGPGSPWKSVKQTTPLKNNNGRTLLSDIATVQFYVRTWKCYQSPQSVASGEGTQVKNLSGSRSHSKLNTRDNKVNKVQHHMYKVELQLSNTIHIFPHVSHVPFLCCFLFLIRWVGAPGWRMHLQATSLQPALQPQVPPETISTVSACRLTVSTSLIRSQLLAGP